MCNQTTQTDFTVQMTDGLVSDHYNESAMVNQSVLHTCHKQFQSGVVESHVKLTATTHSPL